MRLRAPGARNLCAPSLGADAASGIRTALLPRDHGSDASFNRTASLASGSQAHPGLLGVGCGSWSRSP